MRDFSHFWWIGALIPAILIGALLPLPLAVLNYLRPETMASETVAEGDSAYIALDTKTYLSLVESMSAPEFTLMADGLQLLCRLFCTTEHAEDFHYSLQLLDDTGNVCTGIAEYQDGLVSGSISLPHWPAEGFTACLRVQDERDAALLIPLATNLEPDLHTNSVTWTPMLTK